MMFSLKSRRGWLSLITQLNNKFHILNNEILSDNVPQFTIGIKNGFLPREPPLQFLPESFAKLEDIMNRIPINLDNGQKGLLHGAKLGQVVESELPLYDVDEVTSSAVLNALFRDYTFLASGFLLENCHVNFLKTGSYGLGRDYLPENIAVPLCKVADKLNLFPFMEYSSTYAVYNYKKLNPYGTLDASNLTLIRKLEGSYDEIGFIIVHIAMVQHSNKLVEHTQGILDAVRQGNRKQFNEQMSEMLITVKKINKNMDEMWQFCKPERYDKFRTFIMGTKNQPMFPNGVVYRGVDDQKRFYRGESGANDSIIPTLDNLFEVTSQLPTNPLTAILKDFRTYRPANHQQWLLYVEESASKLKVREFSLKSGESAIRYLEILDQISEFRERHWRFTKQYILKYSNHPVATGGSPIVTWLPNQLASVMRIIDQTSAQINTQDLSYDDQKQFIILKERAINQKELLDKEVQILKQSYKGQDY